MITAGVDVNAASKQGKTALIFAVLKGCKKTAAKLIKSGVDVNSKDKYGYTALLVSIKVRQYRNSRMVNSRRS